MARLDDVRTVLDHDLDRPPRSPRSTPRPNGERAQHGRRALGRRHRGEDEAHGAQRDRGRRGGAAADRRHRAILKPIVRVGWRNRRSGPRTHPQTGRPSCARTHLGARSFSCRGAAPANHLCRQASTSTTGRRAGFPGSRNDPIDRTGGEAAQAALDAAARVLERGELFGHLSEGTRSRDGLLHKGRTAPPGSPCAGSALIPVGIRGTDRSSRPTAGCSAVSPSCYFLRQADRPGAL